MVMQVGMKHVTLVMRVEKTPRTEISVMCWTELQEVEAARQWPCKAGGLPHTLRFDPVASNTSGLFLAKVKKLGLEPPSKHDDGASERQTHTLI